MTLLDSIRRTFEEAARPSAGAALPLSELERRVRAEGRVCTRDTLLHEIALPDSPLLALGRARGPLADVADACPHGRRPLGIDATAVPRGRRGLRPTPEDAVRVLGRTLDGRGGSARARWSRLVSEAAGAGPSRPQGGVRRSRHRDGGAGATPGPPR
jgi:hypothetical protein